jgi:hypothetical protein
MATFNLSFPEVGLSPLTIAAEVPLKPKIIVELS